VAVPDAPELSPHVWTNGEMTVEAWVKLDQLPQADALTGQNQRTVLAKGSPGQWEYGLSITNTGAGAVPEFFILNLNGGTYASVTGGQIITGQWHHIVATLKKGDVLKLYQNGDDVGISTNFTGITGNGNSPLYIGRRGDAELLKGWVDEPSLYSRALTAAGSGKCSGARPRAILRAPAGKPDRLSPARRWIERVCQRYAPAQLPMVQEQSCRMGRCARTNQRLTGAD